MKPKSSLFSYHVLFSLIACISLSQANSQSVQYGIVVDAGSTSSKLKVYSYTDPMSGFPEISLMKKQKFKPGLASFYGDEPGLVKYLGDIVAAAEATVPAEKQSTTSIFLFGTAGFRYLPEDQSQSLMDGVRKVLSKTQFDFKDSNVQVISGEEEAAYLWVAINYLTGYLTGRASQDSGVMEMGGGSLQIAFQPREPLYGEEFHITIAGRLYQIYTQSFFNFGLNGLKMQELQEISQNVQETSMDDPCMLVGDTKTTEFTDGKKITFTGTSNPENCLSEVKKLVKTDEAKCQLKPCSIGSVYQPHIPDIKFYALGPFAPRDLIKLQNDILNIDELRKAAMNHCRKTLDELENSKWASMDCLVGLYVPLLTESFGFSEDTTNIVVSDEIGGKSVSWALGAMLINLNVSDSRNSLQRKK